MLLRCFHPIKLVLKQNILKNIMKLKMLKKIKENSDSSNSSYYRQKKENHQNKKRKIDILVLLRELNLTINLMKTENFQCCLDQNITTLEMQLIGIKLL